LSSRAFRTTLKNKPFHGLHKTWLSREVNVFEINVDAEARSEYDDPIVSDINSMAIKCAEYNQPSNPGVLAPADVEIGAWDAEMGAFIKDAFDANAVRVTVRRNNQQSNSVSLFLANVFGKQNCDVSASAVCTFEVTQDAEGNFEMSRPYIVQ
jgi:hypothetical protein